MVMTLALDALPLDGTTQARRNLDMVTVREYADRMKAGDIFPPISVIEDTATHETHVVDGSHRIQAARQAGYACILADVEPGTRLDALWRALGANKTHGKPLTMQDRQHAVAIALRTWPEKLNREIADHVGCSTSLVSKVIRVQMRKGDPAILFGRARTAENRREAVRKLVLAGAASIDIRTQTGAHSSLIGEVRRELGKNAIDYSRKAIKARRVRMQELAEAGHSSRQIAAEVGLTEITVRNNCRRLGIRVLGDEATYNTRHHDPHRILDAIVSTAENLTEGSNLIDHRALTHTEVAEALASLKESRNKLSAFIRRLMQEQHTNGSNTDARLPVQDSSRPDRVA